LGVECPGETGGSLFPVEDWTEIDAVTICFGQGVSVSALQLTAAVSAIANGGLLMKPYLVGGMTDVHGNVVKSFQPTALRQVVSSENARRLTRMMERAVEKGGTGSQAALEGYKVAGKTGTAQKADLTGGGYAEDKYLASFVGFVPAEDPEIVVLVVIDEPQKHHYGGVVAAPVFRCIVQKTLRYLKIPPELATPECTGPGENSQRPAGNSFRVSCEAPTMG
jgi:cell division protein FtsI (penicillin-binding protein 3)